MRRILLFFFNQLYHSLAWAYDLVAMVVSLGQWYQWVRSIVALLPPGRILELGFGTGHLLTDLQKADRQAVGLDESWQMNRQTHRANPSLITTRSAAPFFPFDQATFQSVAATFPAPYLFAPETAAEIYRVLSPGGQLVALLAARPSGNTIASQFVRTIFRLTGQNTPPNQSLDHLQAPFHSAGFDCHIGWQNTSSADLLLLHCEKPFQKTRHTSLEKSGE